MPARHHALGHLAAHQEAAEAGHLPHLEEHARGGVADREIDVGADIVDRDLDGSDLALNRVDQRRDLFLLAGVAAEGARLAARGLDLADQGCELVGVPARHAGDIALAREAPRDRSAGRIARADHQSRLVHHCLRALDKVRFWPRDHKSGRGRETHAHDRVLLRLWQPRVLSRLHAAARASPQRTGAKLVYRPMLLGGVFKATGNQSPVTIPAKGAWMNGRPETLRRALRRAVTRTIRISRSTRSPLMRGAIAAEMEGRLVPYSDAIFRAMWVDQRNMERPGCDRRAC